MALPVGTWQINISGVLGTLKLEAVAPDGTMDLILTIGSGASATVVNSKGFWDEASQAITFFGVARVFKGFLFPTPPTPEPGQDVTWTLAGYVQAVPPPPPPSPIAWSARRNIFGWYAQFTQII